MCMHYKQSCKTHEAKVTKPTGEIGKFTSVIGGSNTLLSIIDQIIRNKLSKDKDMNNIVNQLNIFDIY